MYFNESKLRGLFNFPYFLKLLSQDDNFTLTESDEEDENYSVLSELDIGGVSSLKLPIIRFLYFVYFESEK